MNKVSLLTIGRKLQDSNLYLISIHDLEPSGLIVHAYDQLNSKEYILPVTEHELAASGITRNPASLTLLVESVDIISQGSDKVLQSSIDSISDIKQRAIGDALENAVKAPMFGCSESIHDVLVQGLVELCKEKPVGLDAVKWLGEWLINNNPKKPLVIELEDE